MKQINVIKAGTLTGHAGSVYALTKDPDKGNILYSGSGDGNVIRWDLKNLSEGMIAAKAPANIFSLLIIPQINKMLIGQMLGGIHILDLTEKKEIIHLAYHSQGIFDLKISAENLILAAGGDGILSKWNQDGELQKTIEISEESIRQIAFHPSNNYMALGCSDKTAYIIDSKNYNILHRLTGHENSVFSVCFSPDGKYLLTGSRDARLRVWDAANDFRLKVEIPAHLFTINSIVFSPDGNYFATASRDKTIKIWDAENYQLLKVIDKEKFNGHVNSVNKLIWTDYENLLVSCSDDRSVMVWKIEE